MAESFTEWAEKFKGADFKTASSLIKEKIKEQMDKQDHKFLDDTYEYFLDHYNNQLPVKLENYKTYMVQMKGHPEFTAQQCFSFFILMAICGFNMKDFE